MWLCPYRSICAWTQTSTSMSRASHAAQRSQEHPCPPGCCLPLTHRLTAVSAWAQAATAPSEYAKALAGVPQLAGLGQLFKSSAVVLLTEEETEYNVTLVKHVFPSHLVLQFNCTNTVAEQMLENVTVTVDLAEAVSPPCCC